MIAVDHVPADRGAALPALVADRMLFVAVASLLAQMSLSKPASTLSSTTIIIVLQAIFALLYNGKKLWKVNRKVTPRQMSSAGILAFALILQLSLTLSSVACLGILQTTLVYFFFEILLEITPLFDVVHKMFLSARLSPTARRKVPQDRCGPAVALISLSFLVLCLFTKPSSVTETEDSKEALRFISLPDSTVIANNVKALLCVCIASLVGYVSRGFMSGGIRATGFSSLRRAYGIYLVLAAILLIPINLLYQLVFRRPSAHWEFSSGWLLSYPLAAVVWFMFNSPNRDRPASSRSLVAFGSILIGCFLSGILLHRRLVVSFAEAAVALLCGCSIFALSSTSGMTYRFNYPFAFNELRSIFRHVMERQTTRKIFIFLCMNFAFTFVEVLYGYWTNSIGLISDAVHMLFDCTALAIGLYASYVARMKANDDFPYGYGRFEVVSGYVNGIFLVFISFSVFVESVERLFDPPDIKGADILVVAVLGLLVNIVGLIFFREAHSHSHGSDGCHNHNSNMQGIFLHVLADALGSVGVIISSLLVHYFNFTIADPICSLIIAVLILASVISLLKDTSLILLQRSPADLDKVVPKVLNRILSLKGVIGLRDFNIWSFRSDERVGSICVHIDSNFDGQAILSDIKAVLRKLGIQHVSVQIESDEFVARLEPELRTRYRRVESTLQGSFDLDENITSDAVHSHSHGHQCHGHGHSHSDHSHS